MNIYTLLVFVISRGLAKNTVPKNTVTNSITMAKITFFIQCTVEYGLTSEPSKIWMTALEWYMDHPCKVWFGNPTRVWSTATYLGYSFVLVSGIVSHIVYTKVTLSFGRVIGQDSVYVIFPLTSNLYFYFYEIKLFYFI